MQKVLLYNYKRKIKYKKINMKILTTKTYRLCQEHLGEQ